MSSPEEIVPGVFALNLGMVNAFVLVDDEVTLVDTGVPKSAAKIEAALRKIGRTAVGNIALTHHHPDHRGSAHPLGADARIYVHALDAPVVRGERKQPGPTNRDLRTVLLTVLSPVVDAVIGKAQPADVHAEIDTGYVIPGTGGLSAVHTPGHTAGHLSYIHPDKRLLFVGDAAQNRSGLGMPPAPYTEDVDRAKATLAEIAALDFDTAVFGHGAVLREKANTRFRQLVDELAAN